jgi:hypothetical protein
MQEREKRQHWALRISRKRVFSAKSIFFAQSAAEFGLPDIVEARSAIGCSEVARRRQRGYRGVGGESRYSFGGGPKNKDFLNLGRKIAPLNGRFLKY